MCMLMHVYVFSKWMPLLGNAQYLKKMENVQNWFKLYRNVLSFACKSKVYVRYITVMKPRL
jgi:hypothetical protein